MKKERLLKIIEDCYTEYSFLYKGEYGYFETLGSGRYSAAYNGNDEGRHYYETLDEFLKDALFDGKTILEISADITDLEQE